MKELFLREINEPTILQAMKAVDRKLFVPEDLQSFAYSDTALPLGLGQTISQPYIVAYMTAAIQAGACNKVLEVGTGSGYQTAILAELAREVYTIEIIPDLGQKAKYLLDILGYKNIRYKIADGYNGWPEMAPFDAIVVTAAIENTPPDLLEQLAENGRMIIPLGASGNTQYLILIEKKAGQLTYTRKLAVRFVPFTRKTDED
ncbi:MAG: protein-L-isoaspartate(D-aspartate) O-methyltransferase [Bacteroidales bacterium]|nr:protein-L-isoaspartate(D-aspartate) O-methyltransferase [Bacteroidales bacterium]MDD3430627.1 protein-L-isoaspartate(D-aspartate) O-methyltransferase [Bacteroidales bacterium]MDD4361221.1 protein-L-isoaspartate(D-aspartate) O-methyltransferase [Bacteroidales bacterium]MDD4430059.1 protein-L-isoaspartate(D-aspartate) O-methyltransferase [Bacteroidales bacterium]